MRAKSPVLERIRILTEDELLERLLGSPFYRKEIEPGLPPTDQEANYAATQGAQLKAGAELKRSSYEALFQLFDEATTRLQITVSSRLFKSTTKSPSENAWIASSGERALVTFETGILSTVSDRNVLRSIVGHELGHFGFGHTDEFAAHNVRGVGEIGMQLEAEGRRLSRDEAGVVKLVCTKEFADLHLLASLISQVAELNADRAGLVVETDLSSSIEASMLLNGGAADSYGRYHASEYLQQGRDLLAHQRPVFDEADLEGTHPISSLRALAMEFFACTDVFREITGAGPGSEKAADIAKLLPWIVPVGLLKPLPRSSAASGRALPSFLARPPLATASSMPTVTTVTSAEAAVPDAAPGLDDIDVTIDDTAFTEGSSVMTPRERGELAWLLS